MLNSSISNSIVEDYFNTIDKSMRLWRDTQILWLKAYKNSEVLGKKDAIYPQLLESITSGFTQGIVNINTAFRELAKNYRHFCSNLKFTKQYRDRILMVDVIKDDITEYFEQLKNALIETNPEFEHCGSFIPVYKSKIEKGNIKLKEILDSLDLTKQILQNSQCTALPKTHNHRQKNWAKL